MSDSQSNNVKLGDFNNGPPRDSSGSMKLVGSSHFEKLNNRIRQRNGALPPMIKTPQDRTERQQSTGNIANHMPMTPIIKQMQSKPHFMHHHQQMNLSSGQQQQQSTAYQNDSNSNQIVPPVQIFNKFSNVQHSQLQKQKQGSVQFASIKSFLNQKAMPIKHDKASSQQFQQKQLSTIQQQDIQGHTTRTFSPRTQRLPMQNIKRESSNKSRETSQMQALSPSSKLTPNAQDDQSSSIQYVDVQTLLFGENPVPINHRTMALKNHEVTKASVKKCGIVKAYAANTNQGIIRDYNEDRVSIILNIMKPKNKIHIDKEWPQISFFGVFDGHGGAICADFLRDNLHNFVIQNDHFPQDPKEAITQGFRQCEQHFLTYVENQFNRAQNTLNEGQQQGPERSGSCGCVILVINDIVYIANVGDSRCLMSMDCGSQIAELSRDHKPDDEQEKYRIQLAGGKIYRTQTFAKPASHPNEKDTYVQGPLRCFPGRLSVSRTFGDIEAKRLRFGGNPNVIICEPEIRSFKIQPHHDFVLIGCDGIFDRLSSQEVINTVWESTCELTQSNHDVFTPRSQQSQIHNSMDDKKSIQKSSKFHQKTPNNTTIHIAVADGVEMVIRKAAASRSLDNITTLILGFKNFKKCIEKLKEGLTLNQIREKHMLENKNRKIVEQFEQVDIGQDDLHYLQDTKPVSSMKPKSQVKESSYMKPRIEKPNTTVLPNSF